MEFLELFLRRRFAEGTSGGVVWLAIFFLFIVNRWALCQNWFILSVSLYRDHILSLKTWPHSKSREQTFPFWLLTDTGDATYRIFSMWLKQWEKGKSLGFWPSSRSSQLGREKRSYETEVSAYGLKTFVAAFLPTQLTAGSRWFLACFRLSHSWALRQQ